MKKPFVINTLTSTEADELYNRVSKTRKIDFELEKSEDGTVEFTDNPEFLVLFVGWLRKHYPELDKWIQGQSPCTSGLDPRVTDQEAHDQGSRDYINSPRKIKRQMRKARIKFNKWWNKNIAKGNQPKFMVPTMFEFESNRLEETK